MEGLHDNEFWKRMPTLEPLPGAQDLLAHLSRLKVRWAIATTGNSKQTMRLVKLLRIPKSVPIVTGDDVKKAKPSPDAFVLAAERLGVSMEDSIVVGDSVWDLLAGVRKRALGVGLLSGGHGQGELERAGAFRVYADPADLLASPRTIRSYGPNSSITFFKKLTNSHCSNHPGTCLSFAAFTTAGPTRPNTRK